MINPLNGKDGYIAVYTYEPQLKAPEQCKALRIMVDDNNTFDREEKAHKVFMRLCEYNHGGVATSLSCYYRPPFITYERVY